MTRLLLAGAFALAATAAHADKSPQTTSDEDLQVVIIDDTSGGIDDGILVPAFMLILLSAVIK
jgi:hypothetical protein